MATAAQLAALARGRKKYQAARAAHPTIRSHRPAPRSKQSPEYLQLQAEKRLDKLEGIQK